jgi:hypothetical protein
MFSLHFTYSPAFLALCLAAAGGLAWWMYHKPSIELPSWLFHTLRTSRFLALFLLLVLFLEPLWTALFEDRRPPIVAVLVDDSQSLTATADSAFVRHQLPLALRQMLQTLEDAGVQPQFFTFGHETRLGHTPDSLTYTRAATNPAQALRAVAERFANQNLAAVALVSDGIITEGNNPINTIEQLSVPVFTALVGDTATPRDVVLEDVIFNELSYLNTETPITLSIRSRNLADQTLTASITQGGRVLASQPVALSAANGHRAEARFFVRLTTPGLQAFEAHVQEVPGEANLRNNHRQFFINVLENRVKIALFAGAPHPDVGALNRAFGSDPRYELAQFVRYSETDFYTSPDSRPLREFDLVILHNYPATPADKPIMQRILAEAEQRRLPLFHIVGTGTQLGVEPRLQEFMALGTTRYTTQAAEAFLYTTPDYRDHSSFRAANEAHFNTWLETAPPLLRNESDWTPRPGATVFGKAKIRNIAMQYPLLAVQERDGRKNAVLTAEGLWRYRMHAFAVAEEFTLFDDWLHNLTQWLTVREDRRRFRCYPLKPQFAGDERVQFRGQVYDESYNPMAGAEVKLTVTDPEGRTTDYYLRENTPGAYTTELPHLAEGVYKYRAVGTKNGRQVGTDAGEFSVGSSAVEFVNLQADAELMRQLALRTGGTARTARQLEALTQDILAQPTVRPVVNTKRATAPLHRFLLPLLVALCLLSVEWVLRKRNGLL